MASVETHLTPEVVEDCLRQANRRGRLPEVHWDSLNTFRIALPSRPVVTDLVGRVEAASASGSSRIVFDLQVHRRMIWWMVAVNLACAVVGPWSTERFFFPMYSWYWQPPLCVLGAFWIAWRWPRQALADARVLAPKWISEIRARLQGQSASTAS